MLAKVKCIICGKEFLVKPSRLKGGHVKYCSRKCFGIGYSRSPKSELHKMRIGESNRRAYAEGRKRNVAGPNNPRWGKHCTEETKQKIRLTQLGKIGMPGKLNPMYGKHPSAESIKKSADAQRGKPKHSEAQKQKMRERFKVCNPMQSPEARKKRSEIYKGLFVGDKNPNWRGGTSFEPYCVKFNREFKERCRAWFDYTCIGCGTPQWALKIKLHVHHINYDKGVCCNGNKPLFVALCGSCNAKANGNREQWEKYYTEIIEGYYQGKCYFTKEEMKSFSEPTPTIFI